MPAWSRIRRTQGGVAWSSATGVFYQLECLVQREGKRQSICGRASGRLGPPVGNPKYEIRNPKEEGRACFRISDLAFRISRLAGSSKGGLTETLPAGKVRAPYATQ